MPDIIDRAQAEELRIRAEALDRARAKPQDPGPLYIDGVACCRECESVIVSARLKAVPGCGMCVGCAEDLIQITGGW